MLGIIIQARRGSTRLPDKINLPFFKGDSILDIIITKIKKEFEETPIILATTTNSQDEFVAERGRAEGLRVFRGSEQNVLGRFIEAAEENGLAKIIRVCADNPFLNIKALNVLIQKFKVTEVDYITFGTSKKVPTIKTHFGFWAEGVSLESLKKISRSTNESVYLEHVTNFIYEHKSDFKIEFLPISIEVESSEIRLTVDTLNDFKTAQDVYEKVEHLRLTRIEEIVELVNSKQEWLEKMKNQKIKNIK